MAKKDRINIRGTFYDTVNLHYPVGRGANNRQDDVMLIQGLFRWIAFSPVVAQTLLGISLDELPQITGTCDLITQRAITAFQRTNSRRLLNIDGVIHPASYENRRLDAANATVMAITLLHQFAFEAGINNNASLDFIDGLGQLEPRLKQALV